MWHRDCPQIFLLIFRNFKQLQNKSDLENKSDLSKAKVSLLHEGKSKKEICLDATQLNFRAVSILSQISA